MTTQAEPPRGRVERRTGRTPDLSITIVASPTKHKAVAIATEVNNAELITRSLMVRARAKHSRAIWDKIKPTVNTANPLVSSAGASADATAALARVAPNYRFTPHTELKLQYSLQYGGITARTYSHLTALQFVTRF